MSPGILKQCPCCAREFTMRELLDDDAIRVVGMMVIGDGKDDTVYFFSHDCAGCGTSFTVPVGHFAPLLREVVPAALLFGTAGCGGHCVSVTDLSACGSPCANAPFRRFLVDVLLDADARRAAGRQLE